MNKRIDSYISKIKNKRILIQGLGLNGGGLGAALFFLKNGFDITITDLKSSKELSRSIEKLLPYEDKIKYTLGKHSEDDFINTDIIVKGPGVPPGNKFIKIAEKNGALITSDIEIFFNINPCPVYAVTGSKGKSTVVSVIYSIFKQKTNNAFLGGNITISPLTFYDKLNKDSLVILELSSWQLRDLKDKNFHFNGCAITNILNDHLNYYSSIKEYMEDKLIILDNQTKENFCIISADDIYLSKSSIDTKAEIYYFSKNNKNSDFYFEDRNAVHKKNGKLINLFSYEDIAVPGEHTKINILLAAAFCYLIGIGKEKIEKGIRNFKGTSYRMELIRTWKGIKFYNDTTATIPDASYNGVLSFKGPLIWIAGGSDKNLDFKIIKEISDVPKRIFLLKGNGTEKMKKYINRKDIVESDSLQFLVKEAVKIASKGDVILFSPGCTSFGLFQNEFHRGDVFNKIVNEI